MSHCPHCQYPLPEPPDRFCPNCGAELQAAEPPALPPGVGPAGPAWERRGQVGLGAGLVETTQQIFTAPSAFFRSLPVSGGIGGPLLYGVIVGYVGLAASAIYSAVLSAVLGSTWAAWSRRDELEKIMPFLQGGVGLVGQLVFGPVFIVIGLFVFCGILHLALLLLGGARRGFEATFRVGSYAEAAMLVRIIPLCGDLIAIVYYVVLTIIGLSEAQGISKGRAAAAVLLPLVLFCCCCLGVGAVMLGGLASVLSRIQ